MTFQDFISKSWNDHISDSLKVSHSLDDGLKLIEKTEQVPPIVQLSVHVYGEHLGMWEQGINFLNEIPQNLDFKLNSESEQAIARGVVTLQVASGNTADLKSFSNSDQIRVLATAASAMLGQKHIARAKELFLKAIEMASTGLDKADPANRALAINGNNLACELEERPERTNDEVEFMILAAQTARTYWEIAGGWLEVERAEYRLANSYLKAKDYDRALKHANTCLEIVTTNKALPLEFFFAYQAIALVHKANGDVDSFNRAYDGVKENFAKMTPDNQSWCEPILAAINK